MRFVDLCNHRAGTVPTNNRRERVESLPTFVATVSGIGPGTHLDRTSSLLDAPGHLCLASDDRAEIERDHATLRRWELDGRYTE